MNYRLVEWTRQPTSRRSPERAEPSLLQDRRLWAWHNRQYLGDWTQSPGTVNECQWGLAL